MGRTRKMTLSGVSSSGKKAEAEHLQAAPVFPAPGLSLDCAVRDTVGKKAQCESLGVEGAQRITVLFCLPWDLFIQDRAWATDQRNGSVQVQLGEPVSESAGVTWRSVGAQRHPHTSLKSSPKDYGCVLTCLASV